MWIDNSVDFSPVKDESGNDIYPYNNKTFTLTVNVYANGQVVTNEEQTIYSNVDIKSVAVNNNILTKIENTDYQYVTILPEGTTNAVLDIEPENEYATVNIEKMDSLTYNEVKSNVRRLSATKTVDLLSGDNYFKVIITSGNKETTKEYRINIRVSKPLIGSVMQNAVITSVPTLTNSSNNTSDKSGLYKSIDTNGGEPTYYFRGNVTNNYVSFAGQTWRIVRINEDGTIRLIMQDGINNNAGYAFNSNYNNYTYMYYTNSEIKNLLENWYSTNIEMDSNLSSKVVNGNYFCEQAKTTPVSNWGKLRWKFIQVIHQILNVVLMVMAKGW